MSLYNMLFGVDERAPALLACLGLTFSDIPRFRDCYLRDNCIVVYTRTGGGVATVTITRVKLAAVRITPITSNHARTANTLLARGTKTCASILTS